MPACSAARSPLTSRPAERADANARTSSQPRSRRSCSVIVPTAPVAPTTPMRGPLAKLERLVQRAHGTVDVRTRHVAGDLDRRRAHDWSLDSRALERRERLGRDARMALHAGADQAHLAQVVAGAPADGQR